MRKVYLMGVLDTINNYISIIAVVVTVISAALGYFGHIGLLYIAVAILGIVLLFVIYTLSLLNKRIYILTQANKAISDGFYNTAKEYVENGLSPEEFIRKLSISIFEISKQAADKALEINFGHLSPLRLHELLNKYRQGTITPEEAEELKGLLEEEKRQKEQEGDTATAILIGLILLALLAIILASRRR